MRKVLYAGVLACAASLGAPAQASVTVAGEKVDKSEICPDASTVKCVIKSVGTTATYIGEDRKFITLNNQGEPDLDEYLGHLFTRSMSKGTPYCRNLSGNLLRQYAERASVPYLKSNVPYENHFHIRSKAQKLVGTSTTIDAKAAALAAGVPAADLDMVEAAITAGYNKARNKDVEIWGWFRFYEINPDILTTLTAADAPPELEACRTWLVQNKEKLIWSVTGYKLDEAKVTTDLKSAFSSKLEAALNGKLTASQIAALTASYSNDIEQAAEVNFSPNFTLLTVATAPY